jgi:hypothetical protein
VTTNAKKPGKWPDYAKDAKDETKFRAKAISSVAKEVQLAILAGQHNTAIILASDIRDHANHIFCQMVQAEAGIYEEAAAVQDANTRLAERVL